MEWVVGFVGTEARFVIVGCLKKRGFVGFPVSGGRECKAAVDIREGGGGGGKVLVEAAVFVPNKVA